MRVSRTHARLEFRKGGFVIRDLHSTGGTRVNGERISERLLRDGDVISVADYHLTYKEAEDDPQGTTPGQTAPLEQPDAQ